MQKNLWYLSNYIKSLLCFLGSLQSSQTLVSKLLHYKCHVRRFYVLIHRITNSVTKPECQEYYCAHTPPCRGIKNRGLWVLRKEWNKGNLGQPKICSWNKKFTWGRLFELTWPRSRKRVVRKFPGWSKGELLEVRSWGKISIHIWLGPWVVRKRRSEWEGWWIENSVLATLILLCLLDPRGFGV